MWRARIQIALAQRSTSAASSTTHRDRTTESKNLLLHTMPHTARRTIDIQWCSTSDMIADIMTKPLDKTTFLKHKAWLVYDPKMA